VGGGEQSPQMPSASNEPEVDMRPRAANLASEATNSRLFDLWVDTLFLQTLKQEGKRR